MEVPVICMFSIQSIAIYRRFSYIGLFSIGSSIRYAPYCYILSGLLLVLYCFSDCIVEILVIQWVESVLVWIVRKS